MKLNKSRKFRLRENLGYQLIILNQLEHVLIDIFELQTKDLVSEDNKKWWLEVLNIKTASTRELGHWGIKAAKFEHSLASFMTTRDKNMESLLGFDLEIRTSLRLCIGRSSNYISNLQAISQVKGSIYDYLCIIFEHSSYSLNTPNLLNCLSKKGVAVFIIPSLEYTKTVKSLKNTNYFVNAVISRTNSSKVPDMEYGDPRYKSIFELSDLLADSYVFVIISQKYTGVPFISTEILDEKNSLTTDWLYEYFEECTLDGPHEPSRIRFYGSYITGIHETIDVDDIRLYYLLGEVDYFIKGRITPEYSNKDWYKLLEQTYKQRLSLGSVSEIVANNTIETISYLSGFSIEDDKLTYSQDKLNDARKLIKKAYKAMRSLDNLRLELYDVHEANIKIKEMFFATLEVASIEDLNLLVFRRDILENLDNLIIAELYYHDLSDVWSIEFFKPEKWVPTYFSDQNKNDGHNVVCIKVDTNKIKVDYLLEYLSSNLGLSSTRLSIYQKRISEGFKDAIEKKSFLSDCVNSIKIHVPEINDQKHISSALSVAEELNDKLSVFKSKLISSPDKSRDIKDLFDEWSEKLDFLDRPEYILRLISKGETQQVEFKQTLSLDIKNNQKAKYIEFSVIKTIAAFFNSAGGTLLVGVEDSKKIYGITNEVKKLWKNNDKFLLHFVNIFSTTFGKGKFELIRHELMNIENETILVVECKPSESPCFVNNEFYVRTNPATVKLEGDQMIDYIDNHEYQKRKLD